MINTIDGLSQSGKSTAAEGLGKKLGHQHFNSGMAYRAFTGYLLEQVRNVVHLDSLDQEQLERRLREEALSEANTVHFRLTTEDGTEQCLHVNGMHFSDADLRVKLIERNVSLVAGILPVRTAVNKFVRQLAAGGNLVAEGRDMGQVLASVATFRFFIHASDEVRAQRNISKLEKLGLPVPPLEEVLAGIKARDKSDLAHKEGAPDPNGCIGIDTDHLNAEQVVEAMLSHIGIGSFGDNS